MRHFLLFYETGEDFLARRAGYRKGHLEYAWAAVEKGDLLLGGALTGPADQAVLLFQGESPDVAEVFARPGGQAGKHALLERTLDDIAPIISHLLQRGATPDEVAKSLGREGGEAEFRFTIPVAGIARTHVERGVTMKVSSPVAALAACCIAVQHELDKMPDDARELIREMKPVPVVAARKSELGGEAPEGASPEGRPLAADREGG